MQCRTANGKAFRVLVVIDEYSRECLALHVARKIRSEQVMHVLADLFLQHGSPDIAKEYTKGDDGKFYLSVEGGDDFAELKANSAKLIEEKRKSKLHFFIWQGLPKVSLVHVSIFRSDLDPVPKTGFHCC